MSVIAARYGEARADAVLGDIEDAMLEDERVDLNELPMMGNVVGEASWCNSPASLVGVSKYIGVSFSNGAVACEGVGRVVFMDKPADAGVNCFGLGWASDASSGEDVVRWCNAALCTLASSFLDVLTPSFDSSTSAVDVLFSVLLSCRSGVKSSLPSRLSSLPTSRSAAAAPLMS